MTDNKFRKREIMAKCVPMSILQSVLSGKWKFLILWYIAVSKVQRFGELLKRIDGITQSTLTKQLRELEDDGFIHREIYKEIPPKVEYTLTELGKSFVPVLTQMMTWSQTHLCSPDYVSPYSEEQIKELLNQ
ncbi:MAG: helix-turn-helix transcriptional regulator [Clostridia bacterium]|nr:helix-turn-helix transcriptional regulator [Clostridia bacterium]